MPGSTRKTSAAPRVQKLRDIAAVRAVADPLRLRMLMQLNEPGTAKELAAALSVPTTRLYYHLRLLEEHGLVKVVRRRWVSGIEEKTYRAVGNSWEPSARLRASSPESAETVAAVVGLVQTEVVLAARRSPPASIPGGPGSDVAILTLTRIALSRRQLSSFQERLFALIEEFVCATPDPPPGTELFHLFIAGYRPPGPVSQKTEDPKPGQRRAARS